MGIVAKTYTFSAGAIIVASEHNTNFDTLYNLVNGNLNTSNLAANAALVDTQFAQLTTASKVHGSTLTGTLVTSKGSDIASATTTDIGAATGNFVDVTGSTTITALGTIAAGAFRTVRFTGALILTHHATSLILPTGADITTAAGDVAMFQSLGSGNWVCLVFQRKDGTSIAGSSAPAGSVVQTVNTNDQVGRSTSSTAFPADDTAPQNTEGVAYTQLDTTITPTNASNKLEITVIIGIGTLTGNGVGSGYALFQDSTASALASTWMSDSPANGQVIPTFLRWTMTAGTTSATTFKIRLSGVPYVNGGYSFAFYGNTICASMNIKEIKV